MQARADIAKGRKRIIIVREASGEDKTRDAVLAIMKGYKYKDR